MWFVVRGGDDASGYVAWGSRGCFAVCGHVMCMVNDDNEYASYYLWLVWKFVGLDDCYECGRVALSEVLFSK